MHLSSLLLSLTLAVLGGAKHVLGKAVFAHFMVSTFFLSPATYFT